MALLLAMANTIRFIRPNEVDSARVQGVGGRLGSLHAKVMHPAPSSHLVVDHNRCDS